MRRQRERGLDIYEGKDGTKITEKRKKRGGGKTSKESRGMERGNE